MIQRGEARTRTTRRTIFGILVDEIKKPEPRPGRIKRLFDSIKQLAPEVALILSSAAKIGELIRG
jgi:radical SAM superfamily enzyme with C-terminal helix-hairpin-helix motif